MRPALKPGDVIDVIAPGYGVEPEVLQKAEVALRQFGFQPRIPAELLAPVDFHSNSDAARWAFLKSALLSKDSSAIWCVRGGYGSNRLLPQLAKLSKPKRQKLLIGISDITSLHQFLNQVWRWPTLHAALLDRVAKGNLPDQHLQETLRCLRGEQVEVVHQLQALNPAARACDKTKLGLTGVVRGGNLTTLQSSIGTPWSPKFRGCFVFLEDIGERGYRVDRMLEQFVQAGLFRGAKGVLFGHFTGGEEPTTAAQAGHSRVPEALQRFATLQQDLPVWSGIESGHGADLRPVPLQTPAVLQRGILSIQTSLRPTIELP